MAAMLRYLLLLLAIYLPLAIEAQKCIFKCELLSNGTCNRNECINPYESCRKTRLGDECRCQLVCEFKNGQCVSAQPCPYGDECAPTAMIDDRIINCGCTRCALRSPDECGDGDCGIGKTCQKVGNACKCA